jgi:hypothetical protein
MFATALPGGPLLVSSGDPTRVTATPTSPRSAAAGRDEAPPTPIRRLSLTALVLASLVVTLLLTLMLTLDV